MMAPAFPDYREGGVTWTTMTTPAPAPTPDPRRAAIRRTAWALAAIALLSYGVFLYSVMGPK